MAIYNDEQATIQRAAADAPNCPQPAGRSRSKPVTLDAKVRVELVPVIDDVTVPVSSTSRSRADTIQARGASLREASLGERAPPNASTSGEASGSADVAPQAAGGTEATDGGHGPPSRPASSSQADGPVLAEGQSTTAGPQPPQPVQLHAMIGEAYAARLTAAAWEVYHMEGQCWFWHPATDRACLACPLPCMRGPA